MKLSGTHCSSPRLSHLHSHSGCHTSSGLGCSCYSHSGIHEVHRSFHLFHWEQEKKNTVKKMASKSMNANKVLAIIFSMCNHHFLRVSSVGLTSSSKHSMHSRGYTVKQNICKFQQSYSMGLWPEVDKAECFEYTFSIIVRNTQSLFLFLSVKK